MFKLKLIIVTALLLNSCLAQTITGFVKDNKQQPIPYVSIGVAATMFGITSNDAGVFTFKITTEKETDTLQASAIGYKTRVLTVASLKQLCSSNTPIILLENIYDLKTVTVRPNEYETKTLGCNNIANAECENIAEILTSKDTAKTNTYKRKCKAKGMDDKAIGMEVANRIAIKKG
jgi:hypothetical protein